MELFNHAPLHLPHTNCRKASCIHIARDDLQRCDLFKPAQYMRTHLNQLPLLRLRTQTTCYIPSHFHLANNHAYTYYYERYCPSCLPTKIVGNELHTLLQCPRLTPLSHPAVLSLTRALRSLADITSALGLHTPHCNKPLFSSAPTPLSSFANTTKHGLTLPRLHVHKSFTHSNPIFSNTNLQPLPGPYRLPPSPLPAPPPRIPSARCVKVSLTKTKCSFVTNVTQMAYGLPHPTPHYHPNWDVEMPLVYPSCPLIPGSTATPPLPIPIPDCG